MTISGRLLEKSGPQHSIDDRELGVTYQVCPACGQLTPLDHEVLVTRPMPDTVRDIVTWRAWTRSVYGCACGAGWEHITSWGGAPKLTIAPIVP